MGVMNEEGLSDKKTKPHFKITGEDHVRNRKRIYLEEGPKELSVERRDRKSTGLSA